MKKIFILVIALAALSLSSCQNFLDVTPLGTPTQDNFLKNDDQIESSVKSIYAPLCDGDDLFGRHILWEQCVGITMVPGRTRDWPQLFTLQWNGDESVLRDVFDQAYRFISRANWLVYVLKEKEEKEGLSYVGKRSLGEAYFIRGWLYLTMAYRYGTKDQGIPHFNYEDFPGSIEFSIPPQQASVCDDYAMIVNDFQKAAEYLPSIDKYTSQEHGRACRESALGLMVRAYAYWATWDESQWDNVIKTVNQMEGEGRGLVDSYSSLFNDDVKTWWNKEYCWSIASNGGHMPRTGTEFPGCTLENKGYNVYNGWGQFKPSYDAYAEFIKDGPRERNERMRRTILEYNQEWQYNGVTMNYYGAQDVETGFQINKWMEPFSHPDFIEAGYVNESGGGWPTARINFHCIRFAECMLYRAEANLHKGNASAAASDLNAIRRRAGLDANCTGTWMELYHERVCELMFEVLSDSAFDLKRWAVGVGVGAELKSYAIECLEAHPRALFHVWRSWPESPVGQGLDPAKDASGNDATKDLGEVMDPLTGIATTVKGVDYQQIKTDLWDPSVKTLGEPEPGVGPYQDYINQSKSAKWDDHLVVFPYPSQQITKSQGALKQNAGY